MSDKKYENPSALVDEVSEAEEPIDDAADPRLSRALKLVRTMSNPNIKEQCVLAEWGSTHTDAERDLLVEAVTDPAFWREVKQLSITNADTTADDEDRVDTEGRLMQMFHCFDKDGSGTIDAGEFHQMLLYMGISATDAQVRDMISQADADGDGCIDAAEFLVIMKAAQAGRLTIAPPSSHSIRRASLRLKEMSRR